jgi:phosphoribosylformylglycinamidine synthase subunit PurL
MECTFKLEATVQQAIGLGLKENEFELILKYLERTPNYLELSVFAVMWSDSCSYKNAAFWLRQLPNEGQFVVLKAGEESAGAIDLGDGTACVIKMESKVHSNNRITAIDKLVNDVNTDIVALGAKPTAQLNSLSFGTLENQENKGIIKGITKGISQQSNEYGVPMIGGQVSFNESFGLNACLSLFSVGIVDSKRMVSAVAKGLNNPVFVVGNVSNIDNSTLSGKMLLEGTMELLKTEIVVGMQAVGAGGILGSCIEMSSKGSVGMDINLDELLNNQNIDHVHDVWLGEMNACIIIVLQKEKESIIHEIYEKWNVPVRKIGIVADSNIIQGVINSECVIELPVSSLVLGGGAPQYENNYEEPSYFKEYKAFNIDQVDQPENLTAVAYALLQNPNIASKSWFCNQFDASVGSRTMTENCYSNAAVIDLRESNKAIALSIDSNTRYLKADPKIGAMIAVAESARNVICAGGQPYAITNSLIFGNPEVPALYWQFVQSIQGLKEACLQFKTPVTSGHVAFIPEVKDVENFMPSTTIGMVGLLEDKNKIMTLNFKHKGDLIFILGESFDDISASEYLASYHGINESPAPYFDLKKEILVHEAVKGLIQYELVNAVHDVSEGGLFITLTEMAMPNELGFDIVTDAEVREDAFLFGEGQGRVVVTVSEDTEEDFIEFMMTSDVSFTLLGHVTKGKMMIDDEHFGFITEAKERYEQAIEKLLNSDLK